MTSGRVQNTAREPAEILRAMAVAVACFAILVALGNWRVAQRHERVGETLDAILPTQWADAHRLDHDWGCHFCAMPSSAHYWIAAWKLPPDAMAALDAPVTEDLMLDGLDLRGLSHVLSGSECDAWVERAVAHVFGEDQVTDIHREMDLALCTRGNFTASENRLTVVLSASDNQFYALYFDPS